ELEAVIRALGKGPVEKPGKGNPAPVMRDSAVPPPSPAVPRTVSPAVPPEKGPLTLDRLRALWPRIVEDARREKPMLGALLPAVEPIAIDGATVLARALDPVHAEGLARQRESLAQLIGRYVTEPVRIRLEGAGSGEGERGERGERGSGPLRGPAVSRSR